MNKCDGFLTVVQSMIRHGYFDELELEHIVFCYYREQAVLENGGNINIMVD